MQRVQHARGWSFLPKATFIITLGLITAATGFKAAAVDVFSDPVGFITLTAEGTSGSGQSFLGLGMTQILANRGAITGIAGPAITVNNTLTAGQFNSIAAGAQFFIEFLNGANPGLQDDVVSNNATTVFTAADDSANITGATLYKIFPHWSLNSVFGTTDQAGLAPGAAGDTILVPNPLTQGINTYFYSTGGKAGIGWRLQGGGATDQGNVPLYNDQGIVISKTTATNLNVMLVGAVKIAPTIIPIAAGNNFIGNIYATSAVTLTNSGLYTANPATGMTTTDLLLIHNDVTGAIGSYFWSTGGKAGVGWRIQGGGATDQSNVPIPLGANVVIQLATGHTGFNWVEAAPY